MMSNGCKGKAGYLMTKEERLLKDFVKEHESVLKLYKRYSEDTQNLDDCYIPSLMEFLATEEEMAYQAVETSYNSYKEDKRDRSKALEYFRSKSRVEQIQGVKGVVYRDKDVIYWLKTNNVDDTIVLIPVYEAKAQLFGCSKENFEKGISDFTDRGTKVIVLSFVLGGNVFRLCSEGEVLEYDVKKGIVVCVL